MNKRMRAAILLVLSLMVYTQAGVAESTPLLYQVQDENGHCIYLLGTIHLGNEDMYPLSDAVKHAYQDSEILAVELDIVSITQDLAQMMKYSMALMYGADDSAKNHLSPETYALGVEKLGYPEFALDKIHIASWLSLAQEQLFASIGRTSDMGVDQCLLRLAHHDGKEIHPLETMEDQMQLLLDMPDQMVDEQLRQMLTYPEASALSLELLSTAWEQGNETFLSLLLAQEEVAIPPEYAEIYTAYYHRMYDQRDAAFEEKAIEYLQSGKKVLFAVGAAHIVGENGLADRLEKAGYQVTEIGR